MDMQLYITATYMWAVQVTIYNKFSAEQEKDEEEE